MVDVQSSLSSGAAGPRRPSSLEALRTPKNRCVGGATHVPNLTGELSTASIWYGSFNLVSHYSTWRPVLVKIVFNKIAP